MTEPNGHLVMTMGDPSKAVSRPPPYEHLYIPCSCSDAEHGLRFMIDPNDIFPLYCSVFLAEHRGWRGFFRRCWLAIRYVFGYKCNYGHFSETLFEKWHVERLRDLCNESLKRKQEQTK